MLYSDDIPEEDIFILFPPMTLWSFKRAIHKMSTNTSNGFVVLGTSKIKISLFHCFAADNCLVSSIAGEIDTLYIILARYVLGREEKYLFRLKKHISQIIPR